jgi:hypothetical protein
MYNTNDNTPYDSLVEKWNPLLEHESLEKITDYHRKKCTAVLLENQQNAIREQHLNEQHANAMGTVTLVILKLVLLLVPFLVTIQYSSV